MNNTIILDNNRAAYRVLDVAGFYADDDTLYTVDANGDPAIIYFDGIPNEQLEPLTEPAKIRMANYLESLETSAKLASEKLNRPYVARPRTLDGGLELATALQRDSMSIMGNKERTTSTERIAVVPVPETGSILPKRGRGRPPKVA